MRTAIEDSDREIIHRYTDQPSRLPAEARERIEEDFGGAPIQLDALADLNAKLELRPTWLALGPERIAVLDEDAGVVRGFDRSRIQEARLDPGLSCSTLCFLGEPDQPALARLRFTHRQRRAMENIQFVV